MLPAFSSAVRIFRWVVPYTRHHDRRHLPPKEYSNLLAVGAFRHIFFK